MVVGYPTCLWEPIHAMPDFDINVPIVDKWVKIVMYHDVRGQGGDQDAHVHIIRWFHWGT